MIIIKNDFLKHKQANINVKSRRFGIIMTQFSRQNEKIQSTPDNSNLQGKSKKVRVIGSSSYQELEENSRE